MNKKIRYSLLAVGFVVFLILAPAIILYVRGITYDQATHTFVTTGILGVRTDPSSAEIYLDGKLIRKSAGDIRFVTPDEHIISINKDGYSPWSKRLGVEANQVTWANPTFGQIYLLRNDQQAKTLASGVLDFYSQNNTLVFLDNKNLNIISGGNFSSSSTYPLPLPVTNILTTDSGNNNFVLASSGAPTLLPTILVFNRSTGKFIDLGGLFKTLPEFKYNSNGDLYALEGGVLYKVDPALKTKTTINKMVLAYFFQNNDLYLMQRQATTSSVSVAQAPYSDNQTLLNNLPPYSNAEMLVNYEKQILILADGSLYLANNTMEKLADNVYDIDFTKPDSTLAFMHSGEFDYYSQSSQNLTFVTRSSENLLHPVVQNDLGYGFEISNNKLKAIELDTRDHQNQYTLYTGQNLQHFAIDQSEKNIWLLDNGDLKNLIIR